MRRIIVIGSSAGIAVAETEPREIPTTVQGHNATPYSLHWQQLDGSDQDLAGYTITGRIVNGSTGAVVAINATVTLDTNPDKGHFIWQADEFDTGTAGTLYVTFQAIKGSDILLTLPARWVVKNNPSVTAVSGEAVVGVPQSDANCLSNFCSEEDSATNGQIYIFDGAGSGAAGNAPASEQDRQQATLVNELKSYTAFTWTQVAIGTLELTTSNTSALTYNIDFNSYSSNATGSAIGLGVRLVLDGSPITGTSRFVDVPNNGVILIINQWLEFSASAGKVITVEARSDVTGNISFTSATLRLTGF